MTTKRKSGKSMPALEERGPVNPPEAEPKHRDPRRADPSPREATTSTSPTPSTGATAGRPVADVEDVEGRSKLSTYHWDMSEGIHRNCWKLGRLLASLPELQLYRSADGDGLIQLAEDKVRRIATATDLGTLLVDHVNLAVVKNGKYHGERVDQTTLSTMLRATVFLSNFRTVRDMVTTPVVLSDYTTARPGYNEPDAILCLGGATGLGTGMQATSRFLDIIEWHSNADRTNAVAAFLTVPLRLHWPGGKPFVLVTATKSHAGKSTVCEFINIDQTATARIEYDPLKDWPMQNQLYAQLMARPEVGIVSFDNVRSRGASMISSAYVESFVTSPEVVIGKATATKVRWAANKFMVMLNSNEGRLSVDLLNRSLPIRLSPTGDVTQRRSPLGNPKLEYLPANRSQIVAERRGMIDRWVKAGKPLDESVGHYPMGPWAQVVGGILLVNGFRDFLANYSMTRAAADPIREAIGILAFHNAGKFIRAGDLAKAAIKEGLAKVLLPGADPANEGATDRVLGQLFRAYVGETFAVHTATENAWEKITYRLRKQQGRFGEPHPHYRYIFEEVGPRETVTQEPPGLVLERPGIVGLPGEFARPETSESPDTTLAHFKPKTELP